MSLSAQSGNGAIITPMRRFPPPWTIEEHNDACFIVKDATGLALGWCLSLKNPFLRFIKALTTKPATMTKVLDAGRTNPHTRCVSGGSSVQRQVV